MGEEIFTSYLYQVDLYRWLEENGFGSCLTDATYDVFSSKVEAANLCPTQFLRTTAVLEE